MWNRYNFPVFLLSEESTKTVQKVVFRLLCCIPFYFQSPVCLIFSSTFIYWWWLSIKDFRKKMRRLAMDIEQMLQNSTLLCRFGFFFSPYYVVLTTEAWPFIKWDYSSSNWHELQTTKAQTHDSASCLKEQSCLPLGGHRCVFPLSGSLQVA